MGPVITKTSLYISCLQPLCLAWGLFILASTQKALVACCKEDKRQTGVREAPVGCSVQVPVWTPT